MRASAKTWAVLAAIGTFLGGIAAMSGAITLPQAGSDPSGLSIAVFDSVGIPAIGTSLVFPDGQRFEPNLDGVYTIPAKRAGEEASLRERVTRRELCRIVLPSRQGEFRRVTIPSARDESC